MKQLSTLLCSIALLCTFSFTLAQSQDTALARIDDNAKVKKTDGRTSELKKPSATLREESQADEQNVAPGVKFVVPDSKRNSNRSILDTKVGPNGEELFMESNDYYYLDGTGQKVKTNTKELKDKPKHS
jgi:hypothetical protein